MRQSTKKLNGAARDRFLARLASEPALAAVVTSLRVRRADYARFGKKQSAAPVADLRRAAADQAPVAPLSPLSPPSAAASAPPEQPFDPYGIGLVPVYQREGRDGLLRQLQSVPRIDHLRQLARAQNIALPPQLRTGDTSAAVLHTAIADAVARRIADRRGGD